MKKKAVHKPQWAAAERVGDIWIRTLANELLPLIFGSENYNFVNFLMNHANSNKFFDQVARYYRLHERVCIPVEEISKPQDKGAADIFEICIAACITERQLYNIGDPLLELRGFLKELWSLRYHDLKDYVCHATIKGKKADPIVADKPKPESVCWSNDKKLKENLASCNYGDDFFVGYKITKDLNEKPQIFIPGHTIRDDMEWTIYNFDSGISFNYFF
jgi:hypothetical protein